MVPHLLSPPQMRVQPFVSLAATAAAPRPPPSRFAPPPPRPSAASLAQLDSQPRAPIPLSQKPRLQYRGVHAGAASATAEGVSSDKPGVMSGPAAGGAPPPPPPVLSKSDAAFAEADGVAFVWGSEGLDLGELNDLFTRVGFPRRDPSRLAAALAATHRTVWVRAARKSRTAREGQLLGFARATSDRALCATIWDVAVTPAWQRAGLGRGMVERLTACLVEDGIPTITLYAEPGVVGLYEKLGFVKDPAGVKGLAFQSKSRLGRRLAGAGAVGK